jgi:hypothetical protein
MQGLRFRTNPPYGGALEILRMYYRAQIMRSTIGRSWDTRQDVEDLSFIDFRLDLRFRMSYK